MNDAGTTLVVLGFVAVVSLVLFAISREIVCWYFKINEITNLLGKIENSFQSMTGLLREMNRSLKSNTSVAPKEENQK
jgi:hypothetical protein